MIPVLGSAIGAQGGPDNRSTVLKRERMGPERLHDMDQDGASRERDGGTDYSTVR
jgi:hypothetical protein